MAGVVCVARVKERKTMSASLGESASLRESFAAELADAALVEVSRHQLDGFSIEQELGLWKALSQVVARCAGQPRAGSDSDSITEHREEFLAALTQAAY